MAKNKARLDLILVQKGLVESREKAKSLIMAGKVYNDNIRLDKPGMMVDEGLNLTIKGDLHPYVSRGGLKLAKAIEVFQLDVKQKVIADLGASTGGFSDCALQNGAAKVYAVDVGYGQLDWKLRNDNRVISLERTNARYLTEDSLPEKVDLVVCDVSFISLTKIFPAMLLILKDEGQALVLIKPQFEAGPENVGKNGVVRDPEVHKLVLEKVLKEAEKLGFTIMGLDFSPIRGPEGNIEFLAWLKKGNKDNTGLNDREEYSNAYDWDSAISLLVRQAQSETERKNGK